MKLTLFHFSLGRDVKSDKCRLTAYIHPLNYIKAMQERRTAAVNTAFKILCVPYSAKMKGRGKQSPPFKNIKQPAEESVVC